MSLDYTTYIGQISNLVVIPSSMAEFQTMAPGMIDYAEQRIYRECDFLRTQVTDSTTSTSSGVRTLTTPTSSQGTIFITVDNVNIITPAGTSATAGSRVQLTPVSREFIDIAYPSGTTFTSTPEFWAMADDTQLIFGPSPDDGYVVEIVGTQRPVALSTTNSSTYITQYVPDLFIAASMVFASAYMRNFAADADNPQMAATWEAQYQRLVQSVMAEQARAKYQGVGPSPVVQPKQA